MIKGTVIKSTGSWYITKMDNGERIPCRIIGRFRLQDKRMTNPIAVGDRVVVEMETDTDPPSGMIREIEPRENYIVRQSPRRKHAMHMLASNLDQAILMVTIVEPQLKPGFIDRFLLMTEPYQIPTAIIFNKADLYQEADLAEYLFQKELYESIGYKIILTSAESGHGLEELTDHLRGKVTFIGGQSGVGKSSLVNALEPALKLTTMEISDYSGKGQHTTTFAEWHDLSFGGSIIDTPGIKSLSFNHLEPIDVAHNYREFFELTSDCRFGATCLHRNEPNCAVKEALEQETISPMRYYNYLQMLEEIEGQNHWERRKDL